MGLFGPNKRERELQRTLESTQRYAEGLERRIKDLKNAIRGLMNPPQSIREKTKAEDTALELLKDV